MKTDCANHLAKSQSPIPSCRSHIVYSTLSLRWGISYAPPDPFISWEGVNPSQTPHHWRIRRLASVVEARQIHKYQKPQERTAVAAYGCEFVRCGSSHISWQWWLS